MLHDMVAVARGLATEHYQELSAADRLQVRRKLTVAIPAAPTGAD